MTDNQPANQCRNQLTLRDMLNDLANVASGMIQVQGNQMDRTEAAIQALIDQAVLAGVKELQRRWHDDRKTMDYSPATYDFICDKYIAELNKLTSKGK